MEAEFDGHAPMAQVFPLVSGPLRLGVLVLYADCRLMVRPGARELLRGVSDVLAGMIKRRRAEESLQASEERFALAVGGSDAGIWDWDLRTDRVYFSPRWKSMLGFDETEIQDNFGEWEARLHPEDRERATRSLRDYFEGRAADYEFEHRLRHKDETYRWILARGAVVRDVRGNAVRMVGSHLDITERKLEEHASQERQSRMLIAQKIQQRLLPQEAPAIPGLEVAGASRAAEYTGGDLFDYFALEGGQLGVCVADVSGHGYESALLMATTAARIRSYLEFPLAMDEVMARTNRALVRETDGERFVTMTMAWIEPDTGRVGLINAGNPAGLVIDAEGQLKARLPSVVPPLAVWTENCLPVVSEVELAVGDLLVIFTDGVLEAPWPRGRSKGEAEIVRIIAEVRERGCAEIVEALFASVLALHKGNQALDDLTAVVLRYQGGGESETPMVGNRDGSFGVQARRFEE